MTKRTVPVYVPEGYVVRKERPHRADDADPDGSDAGNGGDPKDPARGRTVGAGGLWLVLLLGLVIGYAVGFAAARHTEPVAVTVTVSGDPAASTAASPSP